MYFTKISAYNTIQETINTFYQIDSDFKKKSDNSFLIVKL